MTTRPALQLVDPDRDAREWLVRLLDDVSPDDLAAWQAWLRSDPANSEAYDRAAEAWTAAGVSEARRPTRRQLASDRYDARIPVSRWRRRRRAELQLGVFGAALTAAFCLVVLGVGWSIYAGPARVERIATAHAEHKNATLSDGSQVRLAAATELKVKYQRRQRTVALSRGEALFQVAHDRQRPFVVETWMGDVTAVGTAFDVHVSAGQVTLAVTDGIVDVRPRALASPRSKSASVLRVAAGQTLVFDGATWRLEAGKAGASLQPAWIDGRLEYRNQSLSAVLEDVNRYAPRPIVVSDPTIGGFAYSGTVSLNDTEAWAFGLQGAFPVTVEAQGARLLLKRTTPEAVPKKVSQPL